MGKKGEKKREKLRKKGFPTTDFGGEKGRKIVREKGQKKTARKTRKGSKKKTELRKRSSGQNSYLKKS